MPLPTKMAGPSLPSRGRRAGNDLEKVKVHGPPKLAEHTNLPFIIIAPQCPEHSHWQVEMDAVIALLDEVTAAYRADTDRIYVTGLSMGGFGTWSLGIAYPDRFAALVPICGAIIRSRSRC